jgi:hypothetical protein
MMPPRFSKATRLALTALILLSGPASTETRNAEPPKGAAVTRINVIVGHETLSATLDDTPAGRDFASLLPLDLTLSDYHGTEKVADLPRTLDTAGAPKSYAASPGDITLYAPWGNLAIFYKSFPAADGLVRLGAFDGPIDALLRDGAYAVRIELAD